MKEPPGPLASEGFCTNPAAAPASSLGGYNAHRCNMSQKRKDREENETPAQPNALYNVLQFSFSRTNYSKIYLQSLNYQRQLERGGGGYKPIKNILTFEYHNGERGWLLPRLAPTKIRASFCFCLSTHTHYRQLWRDEAGYLCPGIKSLTHVSLKRLQRPQTLV